MDDDEWNPIEYDIEERISQYEEQLKTLNRYECVVVKARINELKWVLKQTED